MNIGSLVIEVDQENGSTSVKIFEEDHDARTAFAKAMERHGHAPSPEELNLYALSMISEAKIGEVTLMVISNAEVSGP